MKLIIQIPCFNEENISKTIDDLPKHIDGIDKIELLIINDGTDKTLKVVKDMKVDHVVSYLNRKASLHSLF